MSSSPYLDAVKSTMAISDSLVTLHEMMNEAFASSFVVMPWPSSLWISAITTLALWLINMVTISFPMPLDAPVMNATLPSSLEVGSIRHIQVLDTAYWGFLRVGTMLDIFQNIHILYLEYGVLSLSGYGVLNFIPLWSLVSAGTDTPYLA
ncbi:hypothetical protein Tco_1168778 [Tanacetum coccineum]